MSTPPVLCATKVRTILLYSPNVFPAGGRGVGRGQGWRGHEGPPEPGEAIWDLSKEQWEAFESLEAGNNVMGCIL